jgi:hypothetical protein
MEDNPYSRLGESEQLESAHLLKKKSSLLIQKPGAHSSIPILGMSEEIDLVEDGILLSFIDSDATWDYTWREKINCFWHSICKTEAFMRTIVLCFVAMGLGCTASSIGPLMPALAHQVHVNIDQMGSIILLLGMGIIATIIIGGFVYDYLHQYFEVRREEREEHRVKGLSIAQLLSYYGMIIFGSICLILAEILMPFVGDLYTLTSDFLLLGIGKGITNVGIQILLFWVWANTDNQSHLVTPFM